MKITTAAIGKLKKGPEQELLQRYHSRAQKIFPSFGMQLTPIIEFSENNSSQTLERQKKEGEALLSTVKNNSCLILLDEKGVTISSKKLATELSNFKQQGIAQLIFAIGGADGHGVEIRNAANMSLSFGLMTWPHQIVRILLAEQLYRSATILANHPYHRE